MRRLAMTSTRHFRTYFCLEKSATTWCQRGFRAKICAKSAQIRATKKHHRSTQKKKLNEVYGSKYRKNLDHQILTDHGVFYPKALYDDLVFELTLAPASQVVRGSDPTKLKYKLTNIQLEYDMIRSKSLAEDAAGIYASGKEFAYDHVFRDKVVQIDKATATRINIKVNAQRRSMKAILLLFVEPYTAGARDSEKYSEKNQRHDQRLAKHALQQRHRESGHLEGSQPILHERRTQTSAYESAKVLR